MSQGSVSATIVPTLNTHNKVYDVNFVRTPNLQGAISIFFTTFVYFQ